MNSGGRLPVYGVVRESFTHPELGKCSSYGLKAVTKGENPRLLAVYPDISPDRAFAARLADRCNEMELELIHFQGVAEDAAADPAWFGF